MIIPYLIIPECRRKLSRIKLFNSKQAKLVQTCYASIATAVGLPCTFKCVKQWNVPEC